MSQRIFAGVVEPTQPLSETSFFIDSDVEDIGSDTEELFDDVSPIDSSIESVRKRRGQR